MQAVPAPPEPMTTEEIQQMLEENAKLIEAIQENQSLGNLEQGARYSARLQENLMKLAALADAQAVPDGAAPPAAAT